MFIALFLASGLVVGALVLTQRVALERNLTRFAQADELDRASFLVDRLAEQYAATGSWAYLEGRKRWGPRPFELEPRRHRPPPDRPGRKPRLWDRISVRDASDDWVAGARELEEGRRLPIEVNGQAVGYLVLAPLRRIEDQLQLTLQQRQARVLVYCGGLALLVAGVGAGLLARSFSAPLKALTEGTRAVAGGDYAARVQPGRNDELGQLANNFNSMAESLAKARDARRRWVADIAHELRTPIAVLRGELDALEDGLRQPDASAIASLNEEVRRLGGLVNDLHQLAKADAGALALAPAPLDLAAFFRDLQSAWQARFESAEVALAVSPVPAITVTADADRLRQIFDNLLENAVRYTDAGGRCELAVAATTNRWSVTVSDSAPGVPDSSLPHLFDRLYRVSESRTRERGGSGLGLSIVRSLVAAHGGTSSAAASPLGGLSVALDFPLDATP